MNKLEQAARQLVTNWDSGLTICDELDALREALAEQTIETAERCKWCLAYNGHLDFCPALSDQAEQEQFVEHAQYDQHGICRMQKFSNGVTEFYGQDGSVIMRLDSSSPVVMDYAAPVRTKDLTDDEIAMCMGKDLWNVYKNQVDFARAVIAADREKNKCQH